MRLLLALVAACVALAPPARAEPDERPWAAGVPAERQEEARRRYDEGNLLFEQEKYAQALSIYRGAVELWDHPAIRYNMAVALIHLDQPLAAYENLASALRFGAEPLQADVYTQAQTYRKLLLGQLARLKVGRIFVSSVLGFYRRRLAGGEAKGGGKSGAVVVVQRCSSDLKLNPHFHALFLDGVYRSAAGETPVFTALPRLSTSDVADVLQTVCAHRPIPRAPGRRRSRPRGRLE